MTPRNAPLFSRPFDTSNTTASSAAQFHEHLGTLGTPVLALVEAVNKKGISLVGTVDVQPMVHEQDSLGQSIPRGTIHNVPYLRVQGGASAIIIDPKPGDIGFIIISGRDHSNVKKARVPSPAASFRQFSMSDCVYVGGFLNDAPNQYIHFTSNGLRIVTPGSVEIDASELTINSQVTINAPVSIHDNLSITGNTTAKGDVTAAGVSLSRHIHQGVQAGAAQTTPPQASTAGIQPEETRQCATVSMPVLTFTLNNQNISTLEVPGLGSFPAFSGNGKDRNNPDMTDKPDVGPLPKGRYYIVTRPTGGLQQKAHDIWERRRHVDPDEWFALYRDDNVIDDTMWINGIKRGNFRLHPEGPSHSSKGCVTLPSMEDFHKLREFLLKHEKTCPIPGSQITTYGVMEVK